MANVWIALIGASGSIFAAIIGALVGRSELWERLLPGRRFPRLAETKWVSVWSDPANEDVQKSEFFEFTHQRRERVSGYITQDHQPELMWNIEGDYNGRFLRLFWQPSGKSKNQFFLDTGCYFFELHGKGYFEGVAVGFDLNTDKIQITRHTLKQLR